MTRADAIKTIAANLTQLGDDELTTLAEVTTAWVQPGESFHFSDVERAAIERSLEDFKTGRTLTLDEAEARTDAFLATRRTGRAHSLARAQDA